MLIQTEDRRKLNSELQSLTQTRERLEDWAKKDWPTLSPDAVKAKLAEVRTTAQNDEVLSMLHDAYNEEKLKQDAIHTIRHKLDENTPKLKEHDTALKNLKALNSRGIICTRTSCGVV